MTYLTGLVSKRTGFAAHFQGTMMVFVETLPPALPVKISEPFWQGSAEIFTCVVPPGFNIPLTELYLIVSFISLLTVHVMEPIEFDVSPTVTTHCELSSAPWQLELSEARLDGVTVRTGGGVGGMCGAP